MCGSLEGVGAWGSRINGAGSKRLGSEIKVVQAKWKTWVGKVGDAGASCRHTILKGWTAGPLRQ